MGARQQTGAPRAYTTGQPAHSGWMPVGDHPHLADGQAHVWRVDLDERTQRLDALLSERERERASRMPSGQARGRWVQAHGVLRALLARYTSSDPRELRLSRNAHGKPRLADGGSGAGPAFNLSHSAGLALCAFCTAGEIGVDVEADRRPLDELALAARTFGPEAQRRLRELDPAARRREFLRLWTRNEALLKCIGTGIGHAPERSTIAHHWIGELDLGEQAAGAVALAAQPSALLCLRWRPDAVVP